MGDPGGVGPEVILGALAREDVRRQLEPVIVGDYHVIRQAQVGCAGDLPMVERADNIEAGLAIAAGGGLAVYQPYEDELSFSPGAVAPDNGRAAYLCVEAAARGVLAGAADAMCTAPLSKEAIYAAGYNFPGHTELLAELCGGVPVRMMMAGGGLRVVLQTIHVPLRAVPDLLTVDAVYESLKMCHRWGLDYGIKKQAPRIVVCGLNPHAGEGGHFGREEIDTIGPAIDAARTAGMDVYGPLPGDTVFFRALEGEADIVLAMYHDQALIPVKTLDFHGGVNITVGLPLIRTSPDHGTAFDLVGRQMARPDSMAAALLEAARQARRKSGE